MFCVINYKLKQMDYAFTEHILFSVNIFNNLGM
jgi:hypothetical protein